MRKIENRNDLASELALRCKDSANFEGDLTVAQAQHALKELRGIARDMAASGIAWCTVHGLCLHDAEKFD